MKVRARVEANNFSNSREAFENFATKYDSGCYKRDIEFLRSSFEHAKASEYLPHPELDPEDPIDLVLVEKDASNETNEQPAEQSDESPISQGDKRQEVVESEETEIRPLSQGDRRSSFP